MAKEIDEKSLKQLKKIQSELSQIKEVTTNPRRAFFNGILYGAGAFVGGILAITLLGWLLSLLGFIPGFSEIVSIFTGAVETRGR